MNKLAQTSAQSEEPCSFHGWGRWSVGGDDSPCNSAATAFSWGEQADSTVQEERVGGQGEGEKRRPGLPVQENSLVRAGRTARLNAFPGNSKCSFSFMPVIIP